MAKQKSKINYYWHFFNTKNNLGLLDLLLVIF